MHGAYDSAWFLPFDLIHRSVPLRTRSEKLKYENRGLDHVKLVCSTLTADSIPRANVSQTHVLS